MNEPTKKESDKIMNDAARSAAVCLLHAMRIVDAHGFVECDIEHNGDTYHLSFRHRDQILKTKKK